MTVIRVMKKNDLDVFMKFMEIAGWGLTPYDFNRIITFSPQGSFIAYKDKEPVGCVVSTSYGEVAWIGNLLVLPEMRGEGLGTMLMVHAIENLRSRGVMEIRLDGVQKAIPLYRRIGFREEYWSLRFRGMAEKQCVDSAKLMKDDDFDEISVLDIEYFRAPRIGILRYIQEQFPDLCYVIRVNGDLVGYIMAKDSFDEVKIGPWIVKPGYNDKAEELLWSIMNQRAGRKLWVGVPETNYHCIEILLRNKFESLPSSLRMCLGEGKIRENTKGIYGLGGPDKG